MKTQLTAIIALLVVHFNQDMNIIYWIALIVLFICLFRMAQSLDKLSTNK